MDALTDVLKAMSLSAETYFCSDFASPWGMRVENSGRAQFHAVIEGQCNLHVSNQSQLIELKQGDVVAFPTGGDHWLSDGLETPSLMGSEVVGSIQDQDNPFAPGPQQDIQTTLLCGAFDYDQSLDHPLLKALPCFIHIKAGIAAETKWLAPILRALAEESRASRPGASVVVNRLSEVLFVALLREYIATHESDHGYLAALVDPKIGKALTLIHQDADGQLNVDALAGMVGLSRGAFTVRFSRFLNMSPKSYLNRWRLNKARASLALNQTSTFDIALRAGYSSEAAFSKAFKNEFGVTPGSIRKVQTNSTLSASKL